MSMIERTNAESLIPVEEVKEIVKGVRKESVAMRLMKKLPNMSSSSAKQPVLSLLPVADFVDGDAGMKVTTNMAWDKKYIIAGEVAAIIPVPQAVIDDAEYDLWGEAKPALVESFARVFDRAVLSERNPKAPTDWPDPIIPQAIANSNVVALGTGVDVAEDISNLFACLEDDEYDITSIVAQKTIRAKLRNLRDANNNPIYQPMTGSTPAMIWGIDSQFIPKGTWDKALALAVAGDWSNAVYSIRQDMTFQIFDTGVISDETGKVVYNLMQQDMVAMRAVMRLGWQVANPIDIDRAYGTSFPFAVLTT